MADERSKGAQNLGYAEQAEEKQKAKAEKVRLFKEAYSVDLQQNNIAELVNNVQEDRDKRTVESSLRTRLSDEVRTAKENGEDLEKIIKRFYAIDEFVKIFEPSEIARKIGTLRNAITNIYNSQNSKTEKNVRVEGRDR